MLLIKVLQAIRHKEADQQLDSNPQTQPEIPEEQVRKWQRLIGLIQILAYFMC
jgi:hypothetical protein